MKDSKHEKATFIVIFLFVLILAFKMLSSFFVALIVGAILALSLRPFQKKLISKKINPKLSAYLVFTALVIIVVVPMALVVRSLIGQASVFQHYILSSDISYSAMFSAVAKWPIVSSFVSDPSVLEAKATEWAYEFGTNISKFALRQAAQLPGLLIQTFFVLISCLFFLLDGKKFIEFLSARVPACEYLKKAIGESFRDSSRSSIWATLLAALSHALIVFIGFIYLNIPAAIMAFGAAFLLDFIPFVGPAPVWILGGVYLYLKGSTTNLIILICLVVISSIVEHVVRVVVLKGSKAGLHPLVGLIAVLGGLEVFGLYGVILGPVIATVVIAMFNALPHFSAGK
ncbi:MAG: AI-2E family transporter [bacterium]